MLKTQFLKYVITDTSIRGYAMRLAGPNWEDCLQELALIICEKSEKELLDIQGYRNFWCVRTIRNMNGKRGVMAKYRNRSITKAEKDEIDSATWEYSKRCDAGVLERLEKMHWYQRELFKCYVEEGTIRKVSELTGIPSTSVFDTIKKVKDELT